MKLKTLNENLNGRDLKRQILKCIREVQVSDDFTDDFTFPVPGIQILKYLSSYYFY